MKHRLLRALEPSELRWDLCPEPPVVLRGIVRMGKVILLVFTNPFLDLECQLCTPNWFNVLVDPFDRANNLSTH